MSAFFPYVCASAGSGAMAGIVESDTRAAVSGPLDVDVPPTLGRPAAHVGQALAARRPCWHRSPHHRPRCVSVECAVAIAERDADVRGPRVARDVGQRLLRDPEQRSLGAGRQRARSAADRRARTRRGPRSGTPAPRTPASARRRARRSRAARRATPGASHPSRTSPRVPRRGSGRRRAARRRLRIEPRLGRRGPGVDGEELLLDRVVEVARQPVPLFLRRSRFDAPLVLGAQMLRGRGIRVAKERHHAMRRTARRRPPRAARRPTSACSRR